jgi:hypothetical protein
VQATPLDDALNKILGNAKVTSDQTSAQKLTNLIEYFEGRNVLVNGKPLIYWGPGNLSTSAAGLIESGNGSCNAWGELFKIAADKAKLDGVKMNLVTIEYPNRANNLLMVGNGKNWTVGNGGNKTSLDKRNGLPDNCDATIPTGKIGQDQFTDLRSFSNLPGGGIVNTSPTPAQNNKTPTSNVFYEHVLALIEQDSQVYLFDPSYGIQSNKVPVGNDRDAAIRIALASYQDKAIGGRLNAKIQNGNVCFSADGTSPANGGSKLIYNINR